MKCHQRAIGLAQPISATASSSTWVGGHPNVAQCCFSYPMGTGGSTWLWLWVQDIFFHKGLFPGGRHNSDKCSPTMNIVKRSPTFMLQFPDSFFYLLFTDNFRIVHRRHKSDRKGCRSINVFGVYSPTTNFIFNLNLTQYFDFFGSPTTFTDNFFSSI